MRQARAPGFTIVEVLIVLVVTGLLFLSAVALISGRSGQAEFDQSSRDFQQQIQDAITQVEAGNYNGTPKDCTISAGNSSLVFNGTSTGGQGTDNNCIFIGNVLQFGLNNGTGFDTYVLGGQRTVVAQNGSSEDVTGLNNALPTIVETGGSQLDVVPGSLEYGLHTYTKLSASSMNYSTNGGLSLTPIGAFALVYSFAQYSGGNIKSGSQQVNVVPVVGSTLNESPSQLESLIDGSGSPFRTASPDNSSGTEVTICTKSASTNQYALVTIGSGNGGQLSVTLTILGASNNTTCP
jgi:type II secretory pathway pseudopilin PulG